MPDGEWTTSKRRRRRRRREEQQEVHQEKLLLPLSLACSTRSPNPLSMVPHNAGDARLVSSSSRRDVFYCCGRCGYALNLSSSNRNTANIGTEYGKAIKKGVVSFVAIDESRFTQADELRCIPYFRSRRSWGLLRRRTRLLCRRCGCLIGVATYGEGSSSSSPFDGSSESNYPDTSSFRKYKIKIGALQPSDDDSEDDFEK